MKDYNGAEITTDDQVRCIEPMDGFISYGFLYDVKGLRSEDEGRIVITDDNGKEQWCRATRFRVISDEDFKDMLP